MLPAWETLALTLGAAAISAGSVLAGSWLTNHAAREEREAEFAAAMRRRGAEALAPIGALLADIDPDVLAFNVRPKSVEEMQERIERWKELRERTLVVGTSEPIPHLAQATQRLVVAMTNAVNSAAWLVRNRVTHQGDSRFDRDLARCDYSRAEDLLDVTLTAVRGEPIPGGLDQRVQAIDRDADAARRKLAPDPDG